MAYLRIGPDRPGACCGADEVEISRLVPRNLVVHASLYNGFTAVVEAARCRILFCKHTIACQSVTD